MNLTDEQIKSIVVKAIQNYLNNDKFDDVYIEMNFPEAIMVAIEEEKEKLKNLKIGVDRCWKRWYDIQAVSENNAKQYRFISSLKKKKKKN